MSDLLYAVRFDAPSIKPLPTVTPARVSEPTDAFREALREQIDNLNQAKAERTPLKFAEDHHMAALNAAMFLQYNRVMPVKVKPAMTRKVMPVALGYNLAETEAETD